MASLVATAKLNGVEPLAWLTDVLERMVSGRTKAHELERLLPWTWKAERLAAERRQRQRRLRGLCGWPPWRGPVWTFLLAAVLTLGAVAASFTAYAASTLDKVEFVAAGLPPQSGTLVVPDLFTTIQAAIDAAGDGDTVLVRPGTYPGGLLISGKRITLEFKSPSTGDPTRIDSTIISGGSSILNIEASAVGVVIDGFTFMNGHYAVVAHGNSAIVRNNRFIDNKADSMSLENTGGNVVGNTFLNSQDDCIDVDDPKNVFIKNNVCISAGDDGIEIRNFNYAGPDTLTTTISGSTIVGAQEDGVQIIDYVASSNRVFRLEWNEIRNCVGAGLGIMGDGQTREDYSRYSMPERVYVLNNTFDGNRYAITGGGNLIAINNSFTNSTALALRNVDGSSVARYSLFHGNAADQESSNVITTNDVSADPLYLDSIGGDLRLQPDSPAIDAGTAADLHFGETVLAYPAGSYAGAAPDLGAHETAPKSASPATSAR